MRADCRACRGTCHSCRRRSRRMVQRSAQVGAYCDGSGVSVCLQCGWSGGGELAPLGGDPALVPLVCTCSLCRTARRPNTRASSVRLPTFVRHVVAPGFHLPVQPQALPPPRRPLTSPLFTLWLGPGSASPAARTSPPRSGLGPDLPPAAARPTPPCPTTFRLGLHPQGDVPVVHRHVWRVLQSGRCEPVDLRVVQAAP